MTRTKPHGYKIVLPEDPVARHHTRAEDVAAARVEVGRGRLVVTGFVFALAFVGLGLRLVDVTLFPATEETRTARTGAASEPAKRADILDRNGAVLATSLRTYSLYAHPKLIRNHEATAARLAKVLTGVSRRELLKKLNDASPFVWLHRHLTPAQYQRVNALGVAGLDVRPDERRVYPQGRLAAHVLGYTDVDSRGVAGIEKYFNKSLRKGRRPVTLSIDMRLQHILREEVAAAVDRYNARGGVSVVLDTRTGEVLGMVSVPDFDPNDPTASPKRARFNQATKGVYELGSVFKLLTAALALETGTVTLNDRIDVRRPIHIARFTIRDYHPMHRIITVDEVIIHSSNIGAAKMAVAFGGDIQRLFLDRLGLLRPAHIELPEVGAPLYPEHWRKINTMTIGFGHGIAVSPLQFTAAVAATVNGGRLIPPTLIKRKPGEVPAGTRVLSPATSMRIRYLMRQVVLRGTGRRAAVPGYLVGGKTGTADKYTGDGKGVISSFVGAFPINKPRYVMLVMIDKPKGNKETWFKGTGGLVAAPTFARIVERIAPVLKVLPVNEPEYDRRWATMVVNAGEDGLATLGANGRRR
jgi:cell division protein FtsI (penicillin-binding protein 3)